MGALSVSKLRRSERLSARLISAPAGLPRLRGMQLAVPRDGLCPRRAASARNCLVGTGPSARRPSCRSAKTRRALPLAGSPGSTQPPRQRAMTANPHSAASLANARATPDTGENPGLANLRTQPPESQRPTRTDPRPSARVGNGNARGVSQPRISCYRSCRCCPTGEDRYCRHPRRARPPFRSSTPGRRSHCCHYCRCSRCCRCCPQGAEGAA